MIHTDQLENSRKALTSNEEASKFSTVEKAPLYNRADLTEEGSMTSKSNARGRKLNAGEFILYNSLLFGMCFAKKGGPPIFACPIAGCCCMEVPPYFDVRQRLWLFFFALWFTFFLSMPVAYGQISDFLLFVLLGCVAVPINCILKCHLAKFSLWARRTCAWTTGKCIRIEEILLIILVIGAIVFSWNTAANTEEFFAAFNTFWKAWLIMIGLDLLNLLGKYFFCWCCCRCCIPNEDVFQDLLHWKNDTNTSYQNESPQQIDVENQKIITVTSGLMESRQNNRTVQVQNMNYSY